jgi:hypothetical protein
VSTVNQGIDAIDLCKKQSLTQRFGVSAGNFTGPKQQEIVVAKGHTIELLRPDDTGRVCTICVTPTFAVVRSLLAFRLAGKYHEVRIVGVLTDLPFTSRGQQRLPCGGIRFGKDICTGI